MLSKPIQRSVIKAGTLLVVKIAGNGVVFVSSPRFLSGLVSLVATLWEL